MLGCLQARGRSLGYYGLLTLAVVVAGYLSPQSAFAAGWSLSTTASPETVEEGYLEGVACPTSLSCIGVGNYKNSAGTTVTLAEQVPLPASTWEFKSTPNAEGAKASVLKGISCSSSTACTAVGYYKNSSGVFVTLAERWNGTEWKVQSTPNPTGAKESFLEGVSCASSTACTATGYYENSSSVLVTLAEGWNGTEWKVQTTPNPTGAKESFLEGVSCTSSTACIAVGYYKNSSSVLVTLAEGWNGTEWKVQTTPNPTGAKESFLEGVSCTSSTACIAVGYYRNSSSVLVTLAEGWNGTEWKVQSTPNPEGAKESFLKGVLCSSSTGCIAVGYYKNLSGVFVTLAEKWNGTEWKVQSTPNPTGAKESFLEGVSCSSSTACTATGYYKSSAGTHTLAEHWDGTEWNTQYAVDPEEIRESRLNGVSCSSSTACVAAGYYKRNSGGAQTLVESWNGTEWKVQSTPNPTGAKESFLEGVSCASSTACIAVGYYKNSSGVLVTLAEGWNGTEWKVQSTPNPEGAKESFLEGVSCSSSTACTAAGDDVNGSGVFVSLAERWNGTEWKVQSTPNPEGAKASHVGGVSCPTSTACILAGYYENGAGELVPLAEGWNGTEWTVQSAPSPEEDGKRAYFTSISCSSATACTAAGEYGRISSGLTLAERWNGTEWKIESVPSPEGAKESSVRSVSCSSATACTGAGAYKDAEGEIVPLAEGWSGTEWEVQTTPNPERSLEAILEGVSCSSSTCVATGYYYKTQSPTGTSTTLAEVYE